MRGSLNEDVQAKAVELLGREISQTELRLMPYIQYRCLNNGELDPRHMNGDDRKVLAAWKKAGYVDGGISAGSLEVTEEFWNIINKILWIAYVVQMGNAKISIDMPSPV